jgi:hypothetical protein
MTRSPHYYAIGRGMDVDAGGVAELQTDVMRFMAILSLCLVAIFALVQTLPIVPKPVEAVPLAALQAPPAVATPEPEKPEPIEIQEPPAPVTTAIVRSEPPAVVAHPQPAPDRQQQQPATARAPAAASPRQKGFTLQFEDDAALARLISRNDVGFYAITADKSLRLSIDNNRMNFWPSSTPGKFHEMDGSTVPADVKRALLRSGIELAGKQQWGVTLPPRTAGQLQQFLHDASGGSLIIGNDGNLRLEP